MAKDKEIYTIIRYWKSADGCGLDILGHTKNYSDAAKYIEELASERPYYGHEVADDSEYVVDEIDDAFERPLAVMDIFGDTEIEASCKWRWLYELTWTYAYFYVVASEGIKWIFMEGNTMKRIE